MPCEKSMIDPIANHTLVRNAVSVILLDPQIRKFLRENDFKALKQLESAQDVLQQTTVLK